MLLRTARDGDCNHLIELCDEYLADYYSPSLSRAFDGYTPSVIALIAAETPLEERSVVISKLSTGYIIGGLMGPLIGGVLATIFSIRMTFFITGIILLCVAFISFMVFRKTFRKSIQVRPKSWPHLKGKRLDCANLNMLSATMLIQFVESAIIPMLV